MTNQEIADALRSLANRVQHSNHELSMNIEVSVGEPQFTDVVVGLDLVASIRYGFTSAGVAVFIGQKEFVDASRRAHAKTKQP